MASDRRRARSEQVGLLGIPLGFDFAQQFVGEGLVPLTGGAYHRGGDGGYRQGDQGSDRAKQRRSHEHGDEIRGDTR
jgi:hypothetical protein